MSTTTAQKGKALPVNNKPKREPPKARWGLGKKSGFWCLYLMVLVFWTIPCAALGVVGLLAFIIPGLAIWTLGAAPLAFLLAWYRYDDPFMKH